jgi:hypothetical protein
MKAAMEHNEVKWRDYILRMATYIADQLVFIDKSSFDWRAAYRGYAYALKGQRALQKCFFMQGKRFVFHNHRCYLSFIAQF